MNIPFGKVIAAATLATLVLPGFASAQATTTPLTATERVAQTVTAQATRVQNIADLMAAVSLKLSLRLAGSTADPVDIAAANTALADLNAQIADARLQATAAFGHIASATAAGSTKANTNAELKIARADMVVARQDLAAARKDINKILQILRVAR